LPFADVENSRCILIWGANPLVSGGLAGCNSTHTVKMFNELKEKGVTFIVIDPRTPTVGKLADIHLRVRPGTDGALALGMMRAMIDENLHDAGYVERHTYGFDQLKDMLKDYDLERVEKITLVPKSEIQKAARMFATIKPASIINGTGVEHQTNTVQTLRAIAILLALTGNVDVKGGNTFHTPVIFPQIGRAHV